MTAKRTLYITTLAIASLAMILSFQNCSSQSQFEASSSGLTLNSTDKGANNSDSSLVCPAIYRMPVKLTDTSLSNGQIVTRIIQVVENAPADLRACTTLASNSATNCVKDSDFVFLKDAWGANSYNAQTRTFTTNQEVSRFGYPAQQYISRYKFADAKCYDELMDFSYTPSVQAENKPARLQWVRTTVKACFGPTPSPAAIGQSCNNEGEIASNDCGTATCQFK